MSDFNELRSITFFLTLLFNYSERLAVVDLLIENRADVNKKNAKDYTPLLIAVDEDKPEMCKKLCEKGANLEFKYHNEEFGKKPIDAIKWAKLRGHKDCEKVLIKAKKEGCLLQ